MDVAAAQQVFATRQRLGEVVIQQAHTLKTRALAKLGELLKGLEKATGTRGQLAGKTSSGGTALVPPETVGVPTLADLGIDKKTSATLAQGARSRAGGG